MDLSFYLSAVLLFVSSLFGLHRFVFFVVSPFIAPFIFRHLIPRAFIVRTARKYRLLRSK